MPPKTDTPQHSTSEAGLERAPWVRSEALRAWFEAAYPSGPTPAQRLAWPVIPTNENMLILSPTGTGKTLAAFLGILDRLLLEEEAGRLEPGLRAVYVSPLRSLANDIERGVNAPLEAIRASQGRRESPIRVGLRTGDTPSSKRRAQRSRPPHLLITTPESLSLLLSQSGWIPIWSSLQTLILDELHVLIPTKRGADLAVSAERLAARAEHDPTRIGLSATIRPPELAARFLVGPTRSCRVLEAAPPLGVPVPRIEVESLLEADEAPHRGLTHRRLRRRLIDQIRSNRTTVVFANTRALTERLAVDLKPAFEEGEIAAHHSAIEASRREAVEAGLKRGDLRAVISSTSLELGVDIGTADQTILIGSPGSVARCLQRIGRSGHGVGDQSRGLLLAANAAELVTAAVVAQAARAGEIEPLRTIQSPLDVLCQQLLGIACAEESESDAVFKMIRRAEPMSTLSFHDYETCLQFLSGESPVPAGAWEPEPGSEPRWTAPRIWKHGGWLGIRSARVARWVRMNVGTIHEESSVEVVADGAPIGRVEESYADRLQAGDRFALDGRSFEFRTRQSSTVIARPCVEDPSLPRWTSDQAGLSAELAAAVARFRFEAARRWTEGPSALRGWLNEAYRLEPREAAVIEALIAAQAAGSEVPAPETLLVEVFPRGDGHCHCFHAPLGRPAAEAAGRAIAARLGRRFGRNLKLAVADLGWRIEAGVETILHEDDLVSLMTEEAFEADVLAGLDRGELAASRFRRVAATALMVLKRTEKSRSKVGGLRWVSQRLYPLLRALCPDHPLLRETRREVFEDVLNVSKARAWLASKPSLRLRRLDSPSPFAAAWLDASGSEPLQFEPPEAALRRLHQRLFKQEHSDE